eukprot:CAMPEP_0170464092 /NCGR_PEP_ID=MMETSP0123-20130129/8954_1 /TAXON_ID=182087 /ORGANISM="Favella ehrenbergii, Strain Fehren 1" /LENGTH=318 /DNA_ID=CAMNT_0010729679 /DNA_START=608 /DNA_END=1564 /DNA_ORIENTATION=-
MTRQSASAFGALFTNKDGLQDKFVSYWDHVSARFAKNPFVVGYDPLNEPFPANPARDPMLFLPGHMDKKYLDPMYSKLFETYQKNDPAQSMWFEPGPFPDSLGFFGGYIFPVGFKTPPGGAYGSDKHVLNDTRIAASSASPSARLVSPRSPTLTSAATGTIKASAPELETPKDSALPLFISEFGACLTEKPCTQEITQVGDIADKHLTGWAYWQFKTYADLTTTAGTGSEGFWNQDGTLQEWKVKALARSYVPLCQGSLTHMFFDTNTAFLKASFLFTEATKDSETSVYLNQELWYPNGYDLYVKNGSDAPVKIESKE